MTPSQRKGGKKKHNNNNSPFPAKGRYSKKKKNEGIKTMEGTILAFG